MIISRLDCDMQWKVDCIWQPAMTKSVAGLRRSSKLLPKVKLILKNVMVTVWWSAAGLIHYSFLNLGETITSEKYAQQTDEMHWKTAVPAASIGQQKGPKSFPWPHVAQRMLQKLNKLGQEVLPHPQYSPSLSPTNYHFFKHLDNFLLVENASTTSRM